MHKCFVTLENLYEQAKKKDFELEHLIVSGLLRCRHCFVTLWEKVMRYGYLEVLTGALRKCLFAKRFV
eukprot:g27113.t1